MHAGDAVPAGAEVCICPPEAEAEVDAVEVAGEAWKGLASVAARFYAHHTHCCASLQQALPGIGSLCRWWHGIVAAAA